MRGIGGWIALGALVVGCQKSPEGVRPGAGQAPAEQGRGAEREGTDGPEAGPGTDQGPFGQVRPGQQPYAQGGMDAIGADTPAPIRNLAEEARNIRTFPAFQPNDLVRSLRLLSAAYQALPDAGSDVRDAAQRMASYADRIEASGEQREMHGRWAKRALDEAAGALGSYGQAQNLTGLEDRVQVIRGLVDSLEDTGALAEQKQTFANVYEEIADSLAFAATPRAPIEPGTR